MFDADGDNKLSLPEFISALEGFGSLGDLESQYKCEFAISVHSGFLREMSSARLLSQDLAESNHMFQNIQNKTAQHCRAFL